MKLTKKQTDELKEKIKNQLTCGPLSAASEVFRALQVGNKIFNGVRMDREKAEKIIKEVISELLESGKSILVDYCREPGNTAPGKCWDEYGEKEISMRQDRTWLGFPLKNGYSGNSRSTRIVPTAAN
jgi:hypothetical protein